jgi:hypothetical protein
MIRSRGKRGSLTPLLIAFVTLTATLMSGATSGWARHHHHHKRSQTSAASTDPCAGPRAYVTNRVAEMKALMRTIEKERNAAPRSLGAAIARMEGKVFVDPEKTASLVELRHQADTVNSMMRMDGCPLVDIDRELSTP